MFRSAFLSECFQRGAARPPGAKRDAEVRKGRADWDRFRNAAIGIKHPGPSKSKENIGVFGV